MNPDFFHEFLKQSHPLPLNQPNGVFSKDNMSDLAIRINYAKSYISVLKWQRT